MVKTDYTKKEALLFNIIWNTSAMKLFVFYIGGDTNTSLVELHDVRFAVAEKITDTYDELRASWWGRPGSLHLDCWGELCSADGYNIRLKSEPPTGDEKLWFVNLGGYDPQQFTELHKNVFVVAPTASKAKVRALRQILDWKGHHQDEIFEVEKIFNINDVAAAKNLYIHFEKSDNPAPFEFSYGYKPLADKEDRERAPFETLGKR